MTKILQKGGCPLCSKIEAEFSFVKEGKSFARCRGCGLIYQDPPPSEEETQIYYERDYYEGFGDSQTHLIQQARLSLYRKFFAECTRYRPLGRLLDIGCGFGDFLKMAQKEGWEVWGVEPSQRAAESTQQFFNSRILNETVETAEFPENYFDVITLWNVIDCLPDPVAAVQKIQKWLAPNGLLLIRTPNAFFHLGIYRFYSLFHPLLKKFGWTKEASVFLRANFDARTLKRLLSEAGFRSLQIQNGALTQGDAYHVFSHSLLMSGGKSLVYFFARLVGFLSGNRIFVGSNLIARASKEAAGSMFQDHRTQVRIVIKSVILHFLAFLGYLLGLPIWRRLRGKGLEIQVLLYHHVNPLGKSDMNVRPSEFEKQLDFLTQHYALISLEEAVKSLEAGKLPNRPAAVLTFDDGYEDNYQIAYPLLRKRKLPATIFLLTGEGIFSYHPLLSWEEVREMTGSGITFGSHGASHCQLRSLPSKKLCQEIVMSKNKIEAEIGNPVHFFSYPYGTSLDFDERSERLAREAGYEAAFSAVFGTNHPCTNQFALKRIGIEASDTLFTFRAKLNGALGLLSIFDLAFIRKMIRLIDSVFLKTFPLTSSTRSRPLLLVSVDFPPHADGISTIARELSARISLRGQEVLVIGPRDCGDLEFDLAQPYRVIRVAGYEWGKLRFIPLLFWTPFVVLRCRIEKIFAMSVAYGGILSWALSFLFPLKYLVFAHGYEFEKARRFPFVHKLYRKIFQRAEKVIANSKAIHERLILFGVPAGKIETLYPSVDPGQFHPCEVPASYLQEKGLTDRKVLLTVGRLIKRKGHDQVLKALPEVVRHFPEVLYCIVGIGPHEKSLRAEIRRLGLEGNVRFLGKVDDEELVYLYNTCEVFVMPSREIAEGGHVEGFGIVYLEAGACAKPVIGGRSGGIGEAICDGQTGFLVNPNCPEEIAEKIIFLMADPQKAQEMGNRGMEWVRGNFNWERYTERAYQFLYGEPLP